VRLKQRAARHTVGHFGDDIRELKHSKLIPTFASLPFTVSRWPHVEVAEPDCSTLGRARWRINQDTPHSGRSASLCITLC